MQRHRFESETRTSRLSPARRGSDGAAAALAGSLEGPVARLFRRLGYRVRRCPATHDQGVDLSISCAGLRGIVQCKRRRHPVGPSVVRELYGTLLHTGADLGILATTSTVSRSTRQFAQGKPLVILDGSILQLLLP